MENSKKDFQRLNMMNRIKYFVYTSNLENTEIIEKLDGKKISILDVRSAVYVATGIAAQCKEIVMVIVDSSNASRSAFSGMTEAFYRNLPIILVSVGTNLDYKTELNDIINNHYVVNSIDEIKGLLDSKLPMHIEVKVEDKGVEQKRSKVFKYLGNILEEQAYLYIGQSLAINEEIFACKVVRGGTLKCADGALANILGASLSRRRKRYIGVVTEEEVLHDLNTLGNININNTLLYIVLTSKENKLIFEYAKSLGFECVIFPERNLSQQELVNIINNGKKSLIMICGD